MPDITWADLIRAERTPGAAAVSHDEGEAGGRANIPSPVPPTPPSFPSECEANSQQPAEQQVTTRLVGFNKLKSLLQPVHRYFQDKLAWVKGFNLYQDTPERVLAYPTVEADHRDNPYRRHQLCHKASARTYKRIRQFVERNKLDDFMVASLSVTMPRFISEYLSGQKSGKTLAWGLFEKFWAEDLPEVVGQDIDLASHTNLHLWSSKNPLQAHYHFHTLIPNYGYRRGGPTEEDGDDSPMTLWDWHRQRGGRLVPFSEEQLETLKGLWLARLQRFCHRHGLPDIETQPDIFVDYVDEWARLLHKLNYNGRSWCENFAEYSNDNPECADPPAWLVGYNNRARCKGWWCSLKKITTEEKEKEKISPYTGEKMAYLNKVGFKSLVRYGNGQLSSVEFVRGRPVEGQIPEEWVAWLKEVMTGQAEYSEDEENS